MVGYKWCQKKLRNNGGRFFKFENLQQQIQEIQHTPTRRNTTLKYIIIRLLKTSDKEKNNKSKQGKRDIMYRGTKICQKPCRSEENVLSYIFNVLKGKKIGKLDSIPSK